ncbi:MAG: hypothetical protein M2R45_01245 [Verrucomicrobia subdivision 3 bacterium]|nr:hypothetical protein [Limisphaerales bacterium]MCS1415116.1 hypothetical protein [Limisphaerales bacterium]
MSLALRYLRQVREQLDQVAESQGVALPEAVSLISQVLCDARWIFCLWHRTFSYSRRRSSSIELADWRACGPCCMSR